MTEQENIEAFNDVMDFIRNMEPPEFMEWWRVENTGWSNGQSWFHSGGTDAHPWRAKSEAEAIEYINDRRKSWDDPVVKWRVVHVTVQREENRSITTEIWKEI
jgi:hypothetical protein